jgi:hypothetical protein
MLRRTITASPKRATPRHTRARPMSEDYGANTARHQSRHLSSRRIFHDNAIVRVGKTQHLARDLFDKVGIGKIGTEQSDIALQFGAHGLEALDLKLQDALAFQQPVSRIEAVAAIHCVIGKIGRKT